MLSNWILRINFKTFPCCKFTWVCECYYYSRRIHGGKRIEIIWIGTRNVERWRDLTAVKSRSRKEGTGRCFRSERFISEIQYGWISIDSKIYLNSFKCYISNNFYGRDFYICEILNIQISFLYQYFFLALFFFHSRVQRNDEKSFFFLKTVNLKLGKTIWFRV